MRVREAARTRLAGHASRRGEQREMVEQPLVPNYMYHRFAVVVFFFQAEDGIRDGRVTGVQTCALPISILSPLLPAMPASPATLVVMLGGEIAIGVFIGTLARMLLAALEMAGQFVSLQTGLSNAVIFNPMQAQQSPIPSALYSALGVLLIFLTNLHYVMLRGLVDSYMIFAPGKLPPLD